MNWIFWASLNLILAFVNSQFAGRIYPQHGTPYQMALLSSMAHVLLFTCVLILLRDLCRNWIKPDSREERAFYIFVGLLALVCVTNSAVYCILGYDLPTVWSYFRTGGFTEIIFVLAAAKISIANSALALGLVLAAPLGLWGYAVASLRLSRRIFGSGNGRAPRKIVALTALAALLAIPLEQKLSCKYKDQETWKKEQDAGLVYFPFYRPRNIQLSLPIRILPYDRMDIRAAQASPAPAVIPEEANVFLIVAETMRLSFIQPEIAPNLAAFERENLSFTHTLTSANSTHYAWFSIFYSSYPFYWNAQRHFPGQMGSPALDAFKKAGFKIHVFTTEINRKYFDSQTLYYGQNGRLIDDVYASPSEYPDESDRHVIDNLRGLFKKGAPAGRNLYIIHLESTHHNYFFPKEYERKFQPSVGDFHYYKWDYSPEDVERIRNRYKNALAYLDAVFGEFIATLKSAGIYERAIIGFVGDHGEEFTEHGALIHGNNLFAPQTEVPIFFRIPGKQGQRIDRVVAGMDMLPTLLDAVGLYDPAGPFIFGRSAIRAPEPGLGQGCALIANGRGDLVPNKFALFNGRYKLCFELEGPNPNPTTAKFLKFTWLYDDQDQKFIPGEGRRSDYLEFIRKEFAGGIRDIKFMELADGI